MTDFGVPADLVFNRQRIADPQEFAATRGRRRGCTSCGPTLVTCRAGPRSSAVVYLYAALRSGASADDVLARADADGAPFAENEELRAFLGKALAEIPRESPLGG